MPFCAHNAAPFGVQPHQDCLTGLVEVVPEEQRQLLANEKPLGVWNVYGNKFQARSKFEHCRKFEIAVFCCLKASHVHFMTFQSFPIFDFRDISWLSAQSA